MIHRMDVRAGGMRSMWSIIPYAAQNGHAAARLRLFPAGQRTRDLLALNGSLRERLVQAAAHIAALEDTLSQARQEALTDALTGLCNRRGFDQALGALTAGATQADGLALLLLDADYFKTINDFHGHPLGDEVLRMMAQTIAATIRRTDLAARYGGEEFAVLLPDTDLRGAMSLAETLRSQIGARRVSIGDGRHTGVTVSAGVAAFCMGEGPAGLVARADAGLYRAKQSGRNCVFAGPAGGQFGVEPHTVAA
jgi:diguanylate cyclase